MKIDKKTGTPAYHQLLEILSREIGNASANAQLPSERELCQRFSLSRATVRQTIFELERMGLVYKVQGKGTFVAAGKIRQDLQEFYSFTSEMRRLGKRPVSNVCDFGTECADGYVAAELGIPGGSAVYRLVRLRLADDEPIMYETSWLPVKRFPDLRKHELEQQAMYELFEQKYAVKLTAAREIFSPVQTSNELARIFGIRKSQPCQKLVRYAYENEAIVEYTISYVRGDRFEYSVVLNK